MFLVSVLQYVQYPPKTQLFHSRKQILPGMEVYKIFQHGSGQRWPCCGVLMSVLIMETFRNTFFAHLFVCERSTTIPEPISSRFYAVPLSVTAVCFGNGMISYGFGRMILFLKKSTGIRQRRPLILMDILQGEILTSGNSRGTSGGMPFFRSFRFPSFTDVYINYLTRIR